MIRCLKTTWFGPTEGGGSFAVTLGMTIFWIYSSLAVSLDILSLVFISFSLSRFLSRFRSRYRSRALDLSRSRSRFPSLSLSPSLALVPAPTLSFVRSLFHANSLYDRAITSAGLEFRSDKLWDHYVNWETSKKELGRVYALFEKLIAIPTQMYSANFEKYV